MSVSLVTLSIITATTLLMVYAPQFVYSWHLIGQRRRLLQAEDANENFPRLSSFRFNGGPLGSAHFASLLGGSKQSS